MPNFIDPKKSEINPTKNGPKIEQTFPRIE